MSFREIDLSATYDSGFGTFDAIKDFYTPVLEKSVRYDRVAGYFSSRVLASAARGIAGLIRNNGKLRLITSHAFTPTDVETFQNYFDESAFSANLIREFQQSFREIGNLADSIAQSHVAAMCWMLREGFLEIKVVVPITADLAQISPNELEKFHPKFGILYDGESNIVSFSGSINETESAWRRNIENFDVYSSWMSDEQERRIQPKVDQFEKLWAGDVDGPWKTIELPRAVQEKLIDEYAPSDFPRELMAAEPSLNGLRDYQQKAVDVWIGKNRCGILEMATGTGKTKTARECILSTQQLGTLLTIVVVPYKHIGDQWVKELSDLEPISIETGWRKALSHCQTDLVLGRRNQATLVVVKDTASKSDFIEMISDMNDVVDHVLLVGDEVHWLGARTYQSALIEVAEFRLGLSATPTRYFDDLGTQALFNYFGQTVYALSIKDALQIRDQFGNKILCEYEYHPIPVGLTDEELLRYQELSTQIARLRNMEESTENQEKLESLYNLRADVSKTAASKIGATRKLLQELPRPLEQCLIYCANNSQLQEVAVILHELRIDAQQITGDESTANSAKWNGMNEREFHIKNFADGKIGVLLAIKCLDEGVDIPSARLGIILASSGNTKEFIQRRGRLMRPFPGKDVAVIYDLCVLPEDNTDPISNLNLLDVELKRVSEYGEDAINREEVNHLVETMRQGALQNG